MTIVTITYLAADDSTKSISLPNGTQELTEDLLAPYKNAKSISILAEDTTTIGVNAFYGFRSLTSVTLPSSVTHICQAAFSLCSSLTTINLPDSLTTIDIRAFRNCINLASVTLPSSVTHIDQAAFNGCTNLKTILTSKDLSPQVKEKLPLDINIINISNLISSLKDAKPKEKDTTLSLIGLETSSFEPPVTLHLRKEGLQQLANNPHKHILSKIFSRIDPSNLEKVVRDAFSSICPQALKNTLSLDQSTYMHLDGTLLVLPHMTAASIRKATHSALLSLSLRKLQTEFLLDDSSYTIIRQATLAPFFHQIDHLSFFFPIVENLSLKCLANFALTSKNPLQGLLDSEKRKKQTALSLFSLHTKPIVKKITSESISMLAAFLSQLSLTMQNHFTIYSSVNNRLHP